MDCPYCDDLCCTRWWHLFRQAMRKTATSPQGWVENAVIGLVAGAATWIVYGKVPTWAWLTTIVVLGICWGAGLELHKGDQDPR